MDAFVGSEPNRPFNSLKQILFRFSFIVTVVIFRDDFIFCFTTYFMNKRCKKLLFIIYVFSLYLLIH